MRGEKRLTCYGCGKPIEVTCLVLDEQGNVQTFPGEEYRIIDGRSWCEGCQLQQRRDCSAPSHSPPPCEHDEARALEREIAECRREDEHRYIPAGSRGGSNKCKRYGQKKVGTRIEREAWGT